LFVDNDYKVFGFEICPKWDGKWKTAVKGLTALRKAGCGVKEKRREQAPALRNGK